MKHGRKKKPRVIPVSAQEFTPDIQILRKYFSKIFFFEKDEVLFQEERFQILKESCIKWEIETTNASNLYWITHQIPNEHSVSGLQKLHNKSANNAELVHRLNFPIGDIEKINIEIIKKNGDAVKVGNSDLLIDFVALLIDFKKNADSYVNEKRENMRAFVTEKRADELFNYLVDFNIGNSKRRGI